MDRFSVNGPVFNGSLEPGPHNYADRIAASSKSHAFPALTFAGIKNPPAAASLSHSELHSARISTPQTSMAEEEEDGRTRGSKPICTICYEDLKPLVEHLQAVPICGHVFHELCLQQWLEYCPAGKKPTCPVCNQSCPLRRPTRLYFQSAGDSSAATQTTTTACVSQRPSSEALAAEVRRLELKLASLTANFEIQQTHLKELNDEVGYWKRALLLPRCPFLIDRVTIVALSAKVSCWKESATREEAKRLAIKKEKGHIEQFLHVKTEVNTHLYAHRESFCQPFRCCVFKAKSCARN
ncbi:hypothetical protein BHE74_00009864 [Ensete ventricosum]|nr:hypothetical protein BHE74_00009864 [Ensete ventricosum]RZS02547.1 hypothetical protein BHM03_00032611 [Ensete ventricosum]